MITIRHQPEIIVPGKRLGRHVLIDPRRADHGVRAIPPADIRTTRWTRNVPIFVQGNLGSCEGNSCAGVLSTAPFTHQFTETDAVNIYKLATTLDPFPGSYPPDDTGTDTTDAWKAARQLGYVSTFSNAFTLTDTLNALMRGPGSFGIDWYEGFDSPDSSGLVAPTGNVRGGHSCEIIGCDHEAGLLYFANSWGPDWGNQGYFCMSYEHWEAMLATDGDAIFPTIA